MGDIDRRSFFVQPEKENVSRLDGSFLWFPVPQAARLLMMCFADDNLYGPNTAFQPNLTLCSHISPPVDILNGQCVRTRARTHACTLNVS